MAAPPGLTTCGVALTHTTLLTAPAALLPTCARAYVPLELRDKALRDPLLCPLFASDSDLRALPPTWISSGGCDPLLDDIVEFDTRLRRLDVAGELAVHRSLPHGFFMLAPFLPHAREAIGGIVRWIDACGNGGGDTSTQVARSADHRDR